MLHSKKREKEKFWLEEVAVGKGQLSSPASEMYWLCWNENMLLKSATPGVGDGEHRCGN